MSQNSESSVYKNVKVVINDQDRDLPPEPKLLKSRSSSKKNLSELLIKQSSMVYVSSKKSIIPELNQRQSIVQSSRSKALLLNESEARLQKRESVGQFNNSLKNIKKRIIYEPMKQDIPTSEDNDSIYKTLNSQRSRENRFVEKRSEKYLEERDSDDSEDLLYIEESRKTQFHRSQAKRDTIKSNRPSSRGDFIINSSRSKSKLIKKQAITQSLVKQESPRLSKKSSTSPQFILQNKFYHYCAQQIVDLVESSKSAESKMKQLQRQSLKIKEKSFKLQNKIELQKQGLEQLIQRKKQLESKRQSLLKELHSYQQKVQNQLPQTYKQSYKSQYHQHQLDFEAKMDQIKKQQTFIQQFKNKIHFKDNQNQQLNTLEKENQLLREEINQVKIKRLEIGRKIYRKSHIIEHLNQIKNLQFDNLLQAFKL